MISLPSRDGEYSGPYPKDHYIIFTEVIRNEQGEFGRLSDQSLFFANLSITVGYVQISDQNTQFYEFIYGPHHSTV